MSASKAYPGVAGMRGTSRRGESGLGLRPAFAVRRLRGTWEWFGVIPPCRWHTRSCSAAKSRRGKFIGITSATEDAVRGSSHRDARRAELAGRAEAARAHAVTPTRSHRQALFRDRGGTVDHHSEHGESMRRVLDAHRRKRDCRLSHRTPRSRATLRRSRPRQRRKPSGPSLLR